MLSITLIPDIEGEAPEVADGSRTVHHTTGPIKIGGLGGGMSGGSPSVSIILELQNGALAFAQTSLKLFLTTADALKGRWGDPRGAKLDDGPLGGYMDALEGLAQEVRFSESANGPGVPEDVWEALMRVNLAFDKAFTDPTTGELTRRLAPPKTTEGTPDIRLYRAAVLAVHRCARLLCDHDIPRMLESIAIAESSPFLHPAPSQEKRQAMAEDREVLEAARALRSLGMKLMSRVRGTS